MAALAIVDYLSRPALLRRASRDVSEKEIYADEFCRFVVDLRDTLRAYGGIGLAATQVEPCAPDGRVWRVFVLQDLASKKVSVVVNPRIVQQEGVEWAEDGCLSFRSVGAPCRYPTRVIAKAVDDDWSPLDLEVTGFEARAFKHETDHLSGILMVDQMKPDAKQKFLRRVARAALPPVPVAAAPMPEFRDGRWVTEA
jgi:peptide deformylase